MKGVLGIAWFYFSVVPLQRWLLYVAGALATLSILMFSFLAPSALGILPLFLAGALILISPTILGGMIMRMLASTKALDLRPAGRLQLLAGSLLTTVIIAALVPLAAHIMMLTGLFPDPAMQKHAIPFSPWAVGLSIWGGVSLFWIVMYLMSGHAWGFIVVLLVLQLRHLTPSLHESSLGPEAILPFLGVLAWVGFGYRLLTGPRPAAWLLESSMERRVSRQARKVPPADSRELASRLFGNHTAPRPQDLGPLRGSFAMGVLVCIVGLALSLTSGIDVGFMRTMPIVLINLTCLLITMPGLAFARSYRYLWLRINGSRDDLFRLSERWCREHSLKTVLGMLPCLIAFWFLRTDRGPAIVVAEIAYLSCFAVTFMYLGLAFTRRFNALDALLFIGLVLVTLAALLRLERAGPDVARDVLVCLTALVVALALRGLAHRRWLAIDWTANRLAIRSLMMS